MIRLRYRLNCHKIGKHHEWYIVPRLDIHYCKRCGFISPYRAEAVK